MVLAAGHGIDTCRESTHVDRSRVIDCVVRSKSGAPASDSARGKKCTSVPVSRTDADDSRAETRDARRYFAIDESVVAELAVEVRSPALDTTDGEQGAGMTRSG